QMVILDINLPDGTAFDLLRKIPAPGFKIIFTTAFSKYAIEAFKFSALDYLLKPYTPSQFITSVEKALSEIDKENHHQLLEAFRYNFESQNNNDKKLVLKNAEAVHVVPLRDIIQAQSDNNYTLFFIADGRKILISKSLKEFDQKLNDYGFLRVHQSHLVNLEHARSYNKREDSLLLSDTTEVPVAQSKKSLLWEYFDKLV
ncbi:MAG: LytR/AlgR family response regulator transcription factor, partial [Cyclobacteriaceae bacterium]